MSDNIHKGHRDRVREEFINGGFNDKTPDYKWLELLLFYAIPQQDTNPIAHELINKFGSLTRVFEAPIHELEKCKGISKNTAVLLKSIIPISRKCEIEKSISLIDELTPTSICDYIAKQFYGLSTEHLGVALLSPTGRIIDFKFVSEGDLAMVGVAIRSIVKYAIQNDASCLAIAHNHPNSFALPSLSDIEATKSLCETLRKLNLQLIDHIIVSGNDYVSLRQSREYEHIFR